MCAFPSGRGAIATPGGGAEKLALEACGEDIPSGGNRSLCDRLPRKSKAAFGRTVSRVAMDTELSQHWAAILRDLRSGSSEAGSDYRVRRTERRHWAHGG